MIPFLSVVYAEPLESVNVTVIEYVETQASIRIDWNYDQNVVNYEIGCVSCMPHISEFVYGESVILTNVASLPNSSNAILYLIAYDEEDQILSAKQLIVNLES